MKVLRLFATPMDAKKRFLDDAKRLAAHASIDNSKNKIGIANIEYTYYGGTGTTAIKRMRIDKLIVENESGIATEILLTAKARAKEVTFQ